MTALESILSHEIIQRLGWTLLHFVWQAAAMALLLAILLAALRKASANLRYTIACLALGLIVLLPIVTMRLIPVSVSQPTPVISEPAPASVVLPTVQITEIPMAEMPVVAKPAELEEAVVVTAVPWRQRISARLEPALAYVVFGWLLGVLALSIRHLGGWTQLQRLRRTMVKPVDASLCAKLGELAEKLGVTRAVQLTESALVQIPTVVGWLRPMILLPASALTGLTAEQLEAILAHELAHIRRHDYLVNMLQTIVETLGFYHPAVWWVSHKIRAERENCCDDLAVNVSGDRIGYARALASMAEIRATRSDLAIAASGGNLFGRISRLLGKDSDDDSRGSWIPSAVTIMLIAAILIPTTFALTAHSETQPSAKFLLDKMLEHRRQVKNLQYVAESNMWEDSAAREAAIEKHIRSMKEKGTLERQLERRRESMNRLPEYRYQIQECTIDNAERVKIEMTSGTYDSAGKKVPSTDKHVWAWNGVVATDFSQRNGSLGSATVKDTPGVVTKIGHPWRSFTGSFCGFFEETVAAGRQVSVEELGDGTYRVGFDYKTSRMVAIVDPSKGYTCALRERYNNKGQLTTRNTAKYEQVVKGIWFPVSGQRLEYTPDGSLSGKSTFESSQIRINDPAFNASYFEVNIPKGARMRDYTRNAERPEIYRYGEPRKSYDEIVRSGSRFVAGLAVDENGSPVPDVAVEVCGQKKPRADGKLYWIFGDFAIFNAVTDSQGRFAIELEEDDFYNLRFSPENHAGIVAYHVPVGKSDLKVTLTEGGTISGRVVRVEDGRKIPVPSVEVKAEQSDRSSYSHLGFNRDRKTLTDSQGRFQFNHLRTKMRSAKTRNSEQWEYSPRPWKISHENTITTVEFYEGAKIEDVELVVEPDYANPTSLVGKPLPGFENIKVDFNPKLAKDRKVLVCFWDMNQRPSRNCISQLVKQAERLKQKGVMIVGVQASKVDENTLDRWMKENDVPFPVGTVEGDEKQTRFAWGVRSLPWLILTDPHHVVRAQGFGLDQLDTRLQETNSDVPTDGGRLGTSQQDEDSAAESVASSTVIAKSPMPPGEDKPIIQVDLRILEIYSSRKMKIDRETEIAIENLLGETVTRRTGGKTIVTRQGFTPVNSVRTGEKPTIKELIREAAGTARSVGDSSIVTEDQQATQRLRMVVDLLVSRGWLKILMNPTFEVIDGGKAEISSKQRVPMAKGATPSTKSDGYVDVIDYIGITPKVLDDGSIMLSGDINWQLVSKSEGQMPTRTETKISTQARIIPGMSLIMYGENKPVKNTEIDSDPNAPAEQASELLFILTPTIVGVAAEQQREADAQVEDEDANVEVSTEESTAATAEDKAIVRIDCRVLNIYPMRFDRETTIAAENILGETPTVRGKDGALTHPGRASRRSASTFEEWIREVTGTTVLAEEPSIVTADGQTTRKMIDLLVSRGYMEMLMALTVEVVDGGKGRVSSKRRVPMGNATTSSTQSDRYVEEIIDYFDITPHVLDHGGIKLLAEAIINKRLSRQPSIFDKFSFSDNVVVGPGMSLMITGTQKTDGKTEDSEKPQTKMLFIFTPTIVKTAGKQTDVQTESAKDSSAAKSEFKINLATGVTIELIGMCEYPGAGKKWWRPDGSLLVNPPYDESNLNILSSRKPGAIPIEFAFRLSGYLGEPAWEARVTDEDQAFVWSTGRRAKYGGFLWDIKSIGMFVKSDQRTIDLRLGFSFAGRPYEWVEFPNISVKPNFETDMRVKGTISEDTASKQNTISGRGLDAEGRPLSDGHMESMCPAQIKKLTRLVVGQC